MAARSSRPLGRAEGDESPLHAVVGLPHGRAVIDDLKHDSSARGAFAPHLVARPGARRFRRPERVEAPFVRSLVHACPNETLVCCTVLGGPRRALALERSKYRSLAGVERGWQNLAGSQPRRKVPTVSMSDSAWLENDLGRRGKVSVARRPVDLGADVTHPETAWWMAMRCVRTVSSGDLAPIGREHAVSSGRQLERRARKRTAATGRPEMGGRAGRS